MTLSVRPFDEYAQKHGSVPYDSLALMWAIDQTFEFEVGQIVYFRSALHIYDKVPNKQIVIARVAEECSGGVQRLYRLNLHDKLVHECALTTTRPDYKWGDKQRMLEACDSHRRLHQIATQVGVDRLVELASEKMAAAGQPQDITE